MKQIPWVLLVAAGLFIWQLDGCRQREIGELRGENAMLKIQSAKKDTVYIDKVKTRTIVQAHTDTVLKTDTLFHRDTVVKLIQAEREACNSVIATCEERVALRDLRIKNLEQQAKGESFLGIRLPSRWAMLGLGAVGGYILSR